MIWKGADRRPVDLTGFDFQCDMYSDADTIFKTLSIGDGSIVTEPLAGKIQLNFARNLSAGIKITPYAHYKVWVTTPDLQRKLFMKGLLSFVEP